jgi:hypothetical protein
MALRRLVLVAVAAAALVAPAGAVTGDPDRYDVGWHETLRARGKVAMTFTVARVNFEFTAWSAQVEFRNLSQKTIQIKPQFALLLAKTRDADANFQALVVRRSLPALPKKLVPGQRWKGVIAGPGRPRVGTYVRVNFGFFVVSGLFRDNSLGFSWITDHVFQVARVA